MEQHHIVKIIAKRKVTHDVNSYRLNKPANYSFIPGQATEVSINKPQWAEERRPFTFTCLTNDPFLEFTIKSYSDHNGVTNELSRLQLGDELIVREVWGAIEYKGPGYFIAGGAGVTPFIAIFRDLKAQNKVDGNKLFFSNKTSADIILKEEFESILGENFINTLTDRKEEGYHFGMINEEFLKKNVTDFKAHFYVCGPPGMVEAMQSTLEKLGASPDSVVFEK
jgi:ferredoxin-NADP reductase